jgi:hypothetical protein
VSTETGKEVADDMKVMGVIRRRERKKRGDVGPVWMVSSDG